VKLADLQALIDEDYYRTLGDLRRAQEAEAQADDEAEASL
jgi:hypothetical protein